MQAWERAPAGRQLSISSPEPRGPRTPEPAPSRSRSAVPAGRLQQKQTSRKATPVVDPRARREGAVQALGRHHDTQRSHTGLADARPSWARAKSPLGASQRPCRESSYELNMWKKNRVFMQRSVSMWQQRAASSRRGTSGDGMGEDCDTQTMRRHPSTSASARVSPPPKGPEQAFADALTRRPTTLLCRDEALPRQRALHRHSVALQPPRLETLRKRPDDWHSVDLGCGGLGAGLVALGLHLAGFAFAACVAMVLAVSVLAVLCAVLCTVSLEPEEDSLGVCCY